MQSCRMKHGRQAFLALLTVFAAYGCGEEVQHNDTKVVELSAKFAQVSSASAYDEQGNFVAQTGSEATFRLSAGIYYADIRDEFGSSVYSDTAQLMFGPVASNAELIIEPFDVPGIDHPLVKIVVIDDGSSDMEPGVNTMQSALYPGAPTGSRGRMVWEGGRAMKGSAGADAYLFPYSTIISQFPYVSEDVGAWSALRGSYAPSCRMDDDLTNYSWAGGKCYVKYGSDNASEYAEQDAVRDGKCTGGCRGGQCKAFANLVAYRSGVYHQPDSWAFKAFPSDSDIASTMSKATPTTIQAGDVLRKTGSAPHSVIVMRVYSYGKSAVVLDSNWVGGGNGKEVVGTHVVSFIAAKASGSGGYSDLNAYYIMSGIY